MVAGLGGVEVGQALTQAGRYVLDKIRPVQADRNAIAFQPSINT